MLRQTTKEREIDESMPQQSNQQSRLVALETRIQSIRGQE